MTALLPRLDMQRMPLANADEHAMHLGHARANNRTNTISGSNKIRGCGDSAMQMHLGGSSSFCPRRDDLGQDEAPADRETG